MEKLNLKFEGVSKNLRYIFTSGGIHDLVENKSVRYESLSLIDGINILQEVQDFEYKTNQISLQEHSSNPRRAMISLTNILLPENSVTVLKEWENHFGDKLLMLNESVDSLIIESRINEAWNGVKLIIKEYWGEEYVNKAWNATKDIAGKAWDATKSGAKWVKDKAVQGAKWVGDKVSQGWKWIKDKASAAWNCLANDFVGCLMEGLRSAMYSYVGMAVEAFLTITGVGAPVVIVLYGLMLVWDVYLMASGDSRGSWANLICSALGVLTSGTLAPIARNLFKGAGLLTKGGGIKSLLTGMVSKGGKLGGLVKTLATKLGSGISKVLGFVKQGTDWLAKNFGIKFLSNWVGKAKSWIDDLVKGATEALGMSSKTVSKTTPKTVSKFEKVLPNQHGGVKGHLKAGKEGLKDVGTLTKTGTQFGQDVAQTELIGAGVGEYEKFANKGVMNMASSSPSPSVSGPSPSMNPNLPNGVNDPEIQALIAQGVAA
jgi:hypothetical protein